MKTVIVRPERCVGCLQCRLNCAVEHSRTRNLAAAIGDGAIRRGYHALACSTHRLLSDLLAGRAEIVSSGEIADAVKAKFPWARGALVIHVEQVTAQL